MLNALCAGNYEHVTIICSLRSFTLFSWNWCFRKNRIHLVAYKIYSLSTLKIFAALTEFKIVSSRKLFFICSFKRVNGPSNFDATG